MIAVVVSQGQLISLRAADTTFHVKPLSAEQAREYKLDAKFYKKCTRVQNILIATSERVSDFAHLEAAYLLDKVMGHLPPPVAQRIRDKKVLCVLVGHAELQSDVPQWATDKTGKELDLYNWRGRGELTEFDGRPTFLFSEEDVMEYPGGMDLESVLIHEFGHVIDGVGFDKTLQDRLHAAFKHAMDKGLYMDGYAAQKFRRVNSVEPVGLLDALVQAFPAQPRAFLTQCLDGGDILVNGKPSRSDVKVTRDDKVLIVYGGPKKTYWALNKAEYWAEGVQAWYDTCRTMDHDHNHIHTRDQLKAYDPELAKLLEDVLGDNPWRFVSPRVRAGTGHLVGYDPAKAPKVVPPEHIDRAGQDYYDEYWKYYWQRLHDKYPAKTVVADAAGTTETAKANAFFERVFDVTLSRSPQLMAELGIKKDTDKWDDLSDQHALEDLVLTVGQLAELKRTINVEALDEQARVSYRMFVNDAERAIEGWRWRHHDYSIKQLGGPHIEAPSLLINFHPIATVADARAYIARLRGIGPLFDQLIERMRICETKNIIPPRFVFPLVIDSVKDVISGQPFDASTKKSALWEDFEGKVGTLKDVDAATKQALLADARAALTGAVQPAYEKLLKVLAAQEKIATDDDGVWKFPDGLDYYAFALRGATTTQLTADEIHRLGLNEVARIHRDLDAIMVKVGFKGDRAAFFKFIKEDPQFYYPTTPEGKAAYMKRATQIIDDMRARLDEFFITKPKASLIIKEVEPYRAQGAAGASYEQPSADGSRPGTYYVNTFDMRGLPIFEMETLAHHEALPGHHMQIAIAQELKGMPRFRMYGGNTAYAEGWALYCEYFPIEFGFYKDPYMDFGRLNDELLRAIRLVVDTGIHAKKWTRAQVMDYFRANTPNPERDIVTETNRYIVLPAQATAYKIGMLKILELRELAKKQLGAAFDLRQYHDLVLKNGAVPLNILEENVRAWIAKKKESKVPIPQ
ncbi:MAG: DUF885 domain-containing protein [Planctomycetota bacterium]